MIEAARQLVPTVLTVAALNAMLATENTRCGTSVPTLPTTNGVQDMWAKTFLELTRPGIGYMIGALPGQKTQVELKAAGFNRTWKVPLWIEYQSAATDAETALAQVGVTERAVLYVLEGLEGQKTGWTPPAGITLIETGALEILVFDAEAAGQLLGFRVRYDLTIDDQRS